MNRRAPLSEPSRDPPSYGRYEGKVLQARKKDCGVMYALKVLDKKILASRSRRWQLHCSRELECLKACSHPYVVGLSYAFQTPQVL